MSKLAHSASRGVGRVQVEMGERVVEGVGVGLTPHNYSSRLTFFYYCRARPKLDPTQPS